MNKPVVAIIGRPNVGKSTLFNRIVGRPVAIVKDIPGVTRDRNYANASWLDKEFILIDTGGFEPTVADNIFQLVKRQTEIAISEADVIIFLMDGREGLSPIDEEITVYLRKIEKPVIYAVNKIDSLKREALLPEFYSLGVERFFPVLQSTASALATSLMRHAAIYLKPRRRLKKRLLWQRQRLPLLEGRM